MNSEEFFKRMSLYMDGTDLIKYKYAFSLNKNREGIYNVVVAIDAYDAKKEVKPFLDITIDIDGNDLSTIFDRVMYQVELECKKIVTVFTDKENNTLYSLDKAKKDLEIHTISIDYSFNYGD